MNGLLTAILDLLSLESKTELLIKAKEIKRNKESAKIEMKTMSDDTLDELTLQFGEKLQQILKA